MWYLMGIIFQILGDSISLFEANFFIGVHFSWCLLIVQFLWCIKIAQEKKRSSWSLVRKYSMKTKWRREGTWITDLVKCHYRIYGSIILNPWILSKNNEALAFFYVPLTPSLPPKKKEKNMYCHQELITSKTMVCKKIY